MTELDLSSLAARVDPAAMTILDLALKGTIILAAGLLVLVVMRRASAASRHLVLGITFGSLVALPLLRPLLPSWEVEVPASVTASWGAVQDSYVAADGGKLPRALPRVVLPSDRFPLRVRLLVGWVVGTLVFVSYFAVGTLRLRWLTARAKRVTNGSWLEEASRARRRLRLERRVQLLQSEAASVPMTWGVVRPAVVLPATASRWDVGLLRDVLLHELAHVKRRDCLTQLAVRLACALYWFHPLVWWAAHEMRQLRERACDDEVLAAGSCASEYATHLLEVARVFSPPTLAERASIAFAKGPSFVGRVSDLLDGHRARGSVSRPLAGAFFVIASLAVLPLAAARPWPAALEAARCDADVAAAPAADRRVHADFAAGDIVRAYASPESGLERGPWQESGSFLARGWCPVRYGSLSLASKRKGLSLEKIEKRPSPALPKPAGVLLACGAHNELEIFTPKI